MRHTTPENPAECVADKGYHSRAVLRALNDSPWKTRIAALKQTGFSRWHGDEAARRAVTNNRARLKSGVAREAFKLRAEIVERCFAHNLDRGGMRRTWLRGRENVHKRYLLHVAGHNLSLLMRQLIGAGTPREAVAGGYGGIFVLLTPTGAMLVARGSRKAARRLSPPHSSSGSESRKKPLNQRAVKGRTHGLAVDVEDAPGERCADYPVAAGLVTARVRIEPCLHGVEQGGVDDCGMEPLVGLVPVHDQAEIGAVAQQVEQGAAAEGPASDDPAAAGRSALRTNPAFVEPAPQRMHRTQLEIDAPLARQVQPNRMF